MFKKRKAKDFMVGKPLKNNEEFNPSGKKEKPFMEKKKELSAIQKKRIVNKTRTIDEAFTQNKINASQAEQMKKHAEHHTLSHLKKMIIELKRNKSFKEAHKIAMEKVGK